MKMNKIPAILMLFAVLIPTLTHAATYEYVSTSNTLQTVIANTPAEAFANASNIAPTSGVMLLQTMLNDTSSGYSVYEYVNTSGTLSTITAESPNQAILEATNIAPTSGVMAI